MLEFSYKGCYLHWALTRENMLIEHVIFSVISIYFTETCQQEEYLQMRAEFVNPFLLRYR